MVKRKKRLEKGINSLKEQIRIHEEKREKAEKEGSLELKEYYEKEINSLKKILISKEKLLKK